MAQGLSASVQSLVRLVGVAFQRADLPDDALYSPIIHRDLPWQCPPLRTPAVFERMALQHYLDFPLSCASIQALHHWWVEMLETMYISPSRLIGPTGHVGAARVFIGSRVGARMLRFSTPVNCPEPLDRMAGITFSLEVAHAAILSLPVERIVSTDSDYYVELDGVQVGVKDGRPLAGPDWEVTAAGFVQELLEMPRGEAQHECHFDSLAKARSLLHEHPSRFPEFGTLDVVLQALRFMTWGSPVPNVLQQMVVQKQIKPRNEEALRKLRRALEMWHSDASDRAKLAQMHGTLVPDTVSATAFRNLFYHGPPFPYTGKPEKMFRIREELEERIAKLEGKTK